MVIPSGQTKPDPPFTGQTLTETPPVQEALDELGVKLGEGERIDFAARWELA